jgi:Ni/Fe-hydrogenase subunit HybB-like protein
MIYVAGHQVPVGPRAVVRALRAEWASFPRALRIWFGVLAAMMLVGAVGAVRALFPGDKALATTATFEWGLLIVGYVFFAITTSGLCLASSLGTVFGIDRFKPLERRHAVLAVLCLVTAFGIIAIDLHYPVRMIFGAVFHPSPSSPMWWMGVVYGGYLCILLVEVWSMFAGYRRIHQAACTAAACTAIVAPGTLGAVFAVMASRPYWHGLFTPPLMVASAFLSGTALLGVAFFFVYRFRLRSHERGTSHGIPAIRFLLTIGLLVVLALVARQVIGGLVGDEPGLADATAAVVSGPLAIPFWGGRVVGGLLVPLLLIALPATRTPAGTFAAAGLAIAGIFLDRVIFVMAGQITPMTAVSGVVSTPYAGYFPSPVEIAVLIGAVGVVGFAYTLAERYLDLGEKEMHAVSLRWLLRISPLRLWRTLRPAQASAQSALPEGSVRAR